MIIIIIILTDLAGGGALGGLHTLPSHPALVNLFFLFLLLRNANRQTNNLQFSGKQSREGTFTGTSVEVACKLL